MMNHKCVWHVVLSKTASCSGNRVVEFEKGGKQKDRIRTIALLIEPMVFLFCIFFGLIRRLVALVFKLVTVQASNNNVVTSPLTFTCGVWQLADGRGAYMVMGTKQQYSRVGYSLISIFLIRK